MPYFLYNDDMYICLCNALKDSEIARAIKGGASSVGATFGCFGCEPKCGKCIPHIESQIQKTTQKTSH